MDDKSKPLFYHYSFVFADGTKQEFRVELDSKTLNTIQPASRVCPEWAELSYFRCPNCSLDENSVKYCPVAVNLADIVDAFKSSASFEKVEVSVETDSRKYSKHTTLQRGVSSLIGIYMVSSGCPVMEKLKPMVRYHLPFATEGETKYRAISMYLMAQYFLHKKGLGADWELKKLAAIYEEVRITNRSFCKRLSNIKIEDASINAVVILDCFADIVKFSIKGDVLKEMEDAFAAYINGD